MQIYLNAIFNHFRALQAWAVGKDAKLTLDVKTFELEVKYRGRYYAMHPLFQARVDGRGVHSNVMSTEVFGFGGWRPYRLIRHTHSTDKRLFKAFVKDSGLRTPASLQWRDGSGAPSFDYLLKGAVGSFGREIAGPFRAGTLPFDSVGKTSGGQKDIFAEEFVQGRILKVWFWGAKPFFAHWHDYPLITGDGVRTVENLVREKVRGGGQEWDEGTDREIVLACLRFQHTKWDTILPIGEARWVDYRYSQHYEKSGGVTPHTDNALPDLLLKTGNQLDRMGAALASMLSGTFALPVMITVDGMLDEYGNVWWVEMNTNSISPPEAYAAMFADLFN